MELSIAKFLEATKVPRGFVRGRVYGYHSEDCFGLVDAGSCVKVRFSEDFPGNRKVVAVDKYVRIFLPLRENGELVLGAKTAIFSVKPFDTMVVANIEGPSTKGKLELACRAMHGTVIIYKYN